MDMINNENGSKVLPPVGSQVECRDEDCFGQIGHVVSHGRNRRGVDLLVVSVGGSTVELYDFDTV